MNLKHMLIPDETIIEYRNGEKRSVVFSNSEIQFKSTTNFGSISCYKDNLKNLELKEYDIMKIYRVIEDGKNLELVWQRKEVKL